MDALRQTCLRSQLAAGHKVTVYSFDAIPGLPAGVGNADAEAILPHAFSKRLRPPQPDGSWRDWTTVQFSDFFRMKLMAKGLGLWLDADVLLLRPIEIDLAKPYFAWERPRLLGNSVVYLPPAHGIVAAFEELMEQEELTPNWLSTRHRIAFELCRLRGGSNRLSDIRVAIFGPAALTALARRTGALGCALPKQSFYAVHAEPKLFFEPSSYLGLVTAPKIIGLHVSPKGRGSQKPIPGSLYAWATERFA